MGAISDMSQLPAVSCRRQAQKPLAGGYHASTHRGLTRPRHPDRCGRLAPERRRVIWADWTGRQVQGDLAAARRGDSILDAVARRWLARCRRPLRRLAAKGCATARCREARRSFRAKIGLKAPAAAALRALRRCRSSHDTETPGEARKAGVFLRQQSANNEPRTGRGSLSNDLTVGCGNKGRGGVVVPQKLQLGGD